MQIEVYKHIYKYTQTNTTGMHTSKRLFQIEGAPARLLH